MELEFIKENVFAGPSLSPPGSQKLKVTLTCVKRRFSGQRQTTFGAKVTSGPQINKMQNKITKKDKKFDKKDTHHGKQR
jgi:hypothetical protein